SPSIFYGPVIRTVFLLTQSFIRLNILVPSLIITKNIIRMLLFKFSEWSEDLADWKREVYVNCSYDGVLVTQEEEEFPQNWETDGILGSESPITVSINYLVIIYSNKL
ncbi:Protein TIC 214, partial [Linum grandiflorum]